ncbi:hypothetical protein K8T06_15175 [bacterium]|nr:hypothetical protein [bacterium]
MGGNCKVKVLVKIKRVHWYSFWSIALFHLLCTTKKILFVVVIMVAPTICTAVNSQFPVEFRLGESDPAPGLTQKTVRGSERQVYLYKQAVLTNTHILSAKVRLSPYGPEIDITFTKEGQDIFARLTRENINKILAIIVNSEVISAPIIGAEISNGVAVIVGCFTEEEARHIVKGIMGKEK